MDDIDDDTLRAVLAAACSDAAEQEFQSVVTVASAMRPIVRSDSDPVAALIAGLEYHLVVGDSRGATGPFGPMMEFDGRRYPPPLDQIETVLPGTHALWERAAVDAPLPLVRARFTDLLWEAKAGDRPHTFAQAAIDNYIEASTAPFGHPVELCEALQRAVEIASQINDEARRAQAIEAAATMTARAIASEERLPGVALPLLELFVNDRADRRPSNTEEMLDSAALRFGDDAWNLESVLELQARLKPHDERGPLRERQVEAFRSLAQRSTGLVKYAHLQHAIELAEEHGLRELADGIRREVEAISDDELDLKEISAEVTIPHEKIDAFVDWFVGDDSLESALARFGSYVPSGDPDENRTYVEELMSNHPVQFLFTRMKIGPENSLIRATQGVDDQADQALLDHEVQRISMFSLFAVDILERLRERYRPLPSASGWFESELIESNVAAKVGRAAELFEAGDSDSAAAILAPRIERIVRRTASAVGVPVTRSPDRRGRSGGVKGLGELVGLLEIPPTP